MIISDALTPNVCPLRFCGSGYGRPDMMLEPHLASYQRWSHKLRVARKGAHLTADSRDVSLTLLYIIATAVGTTDFVASVLFGSQYLGKVPVTMFA